MFYLQFKGPTLSEVMSDLSQPLDIRLHTQLSQNRPNHKKCHYHVQSTPLRKQWKNSHSRKGHQRSKDVHQHAQLQHPSRTYVETSTHNRHNHRWEVKPNMETAQASQDMFSRKYGYGHQHAKDGARHSSEDCGCRCDQRSEFFDDPVRCVPQSLEAWCFRHEEEHTNQHERRPHELRREQRSESRQQTKKKNSLQDGSCDDRHRSHRPPQICSSTVKIVNVQEHPTPRQVTSPGLPPRDEKRRGSHCTSNC